MTRLVFVVLLLTIVVNRARADCDHFKWPLVREKAWFAAAPEPIGAGADIVVADKTFHLSLQPNETAAYAVPLLKPAATGTYGGVVKLAAIPKAGIYEVTLSREAWVDIVQSNARAKSRNVSRQRDCAQMQKSVRFQLVGGPAALQISGAAAPAITFAVAAAP